MKPYYWLSPADTPMTVLEAAQALVRKSKTRVETDDQGSTFLRRVEVDWDTWVNLANAVNSALSEADDRTIGTGVAAGGTPRGVSSHPSPPSASESATGYAKERDRAFRVWGCKTFHPPGWECPHCHGFVVRHMTDGIYRCNDCFADVSHTLGSGEVGEPLSRSAPASSEPKDAA